MDKINWKMRKTQSNTLTRAVSLYDRSIDPANYRELPDSTRARLFADYYTHLMANGVYDSKAHSNLICNLSFDGSTYVRDLWLGTIGESNNHPTMPTVKAKPTEDRLGLSFGYDTVLYDFEQYLATVPIKAGSVRSPGPDIAFVNDSDLYHNYPYGCHGIMALGGGGKTTFSQHYLTSIGKSLAVQVPTDMRLQLNGKYSPFVTWGEPDFRAIFDISDLLSLTHETVICSEYIVIESASNMLLSINKSIGAGGLSKAIRMMCAAISAWAEKNNRKVFLILNPIESRRDIYESMVDLMLGSCTTVSLVDLAKTNSVYITNRSPYNPLNEGSGANGLIPSIVTSGSQFSDDRTWIKLKFNGDRRRDPTVPYEVFETNIYHKTGTILSDIGIEDEESTSVFNDLMEDPRSRSSNARAKSSIRSGRKKRAK